MDVRVRCCSLTKPAADGSIIGETCVRNYLESSEYKLSVEGKLTLGYLTHRGRSVECLPASVNSPKLKSTIGRDDSGLVLSEGAPTYTHYVKEFYIENVPGEGPWLCALVHIFDEDGFDKIAAENIRRLKALIRAGVKLTCSLVVLAYWDGSSKGVDFCKSIKSIKSLDWTANPSFGPLARITEVIDDDNIEKDALEKEFSEIDSDSLFIKSQPKEGEIKVKAFSDLSAFNCGNLPKSSKINGQYTVLKAKMYSAVCDITDVTVADDRDFQKSFSVASIKDRVREAKLSPRLRFRKLYLNYKSVVKQMGGPEKIDPEVIKILKSLFTVDVLDIMKTITPLVIQGRPINALIGAASLGKSVRVASQELMIPFRMAMNEAKKNGFLSKMRYQKLQEAYMKFINALIEDVFGPAVTSETNSDTSEDDVLTNTITNSGGK